MVAVRDDLAEAHRLAWEHLARPGSWFTGEQRVELASTVVAAVVDPDPTPPWVAFTTTGLQSLDALAAPAAAHDLAYRLARHAGTITSDVHAAAAQALGDLAYVEVCAIVSTTAAVAHFCRNIGVDVPDFPTPETGEPTGEQPDEVVAAELNWVPVAAPADQTAAVVQAYSAVPGELANTWRMASAQYMPEDKMSHPDWMRRPGGLTRAQTELVAARVAQLRECFY